MIVYTSRTGNNRHIIEQLKLPSVEIEKGLQVGENCFLLTYTDGLGQVPKLVDEFLEYNYTYCKGVIASGNSNFGINNFCGSADRISQKYDIPIIRKIELRGFEADYLHIVNEYNEKVIGDVD